PDELIAWLRRGAVATAPADTGYEYSNLGYAVLGMVAETVTGRTFTELVCTDILGPLGLTRTGFDHPDFPDLAPGLRVDLDAGLHPAQLPTPVVCSPIGGLIPTVHHIGTWMSPHLDALDDLEAKPGTLRHLLTGSQQGRRLMESHRSKHHTE